MADIRFANIGNALATGMAGPSGAETEYRNALIRQKNQEFAREEADAPHVGALLKGDRTALDRVSPKTAMKLAPYLQQMDTAQRTKAKEAADFTARASNAILKTDPTQRPAVYAQLLELGKSQGFDLSKLPPQYTPDLEPQLRTWRIMADQFLKEDSGQPTAMEPLGGGGASSGQAIGGIESGGKYDAVGPVANAQGNRAYGKYQVLDSNIGPWTQEVLGKQMTPQEFLASPQAQDTVFNTKFAQYEKQFGSKEAAARAWFAGPGGMNNPNAKDVLGTTVAGYGQKFTQATGGAPAVPQGDGGLSGSPAGNGPAPADPQEVMTVRRYVHSKIPGAAPLTVNGMPAYDKSGRLAIQLPGGQRDFIDVPKPKDPGAGPAGPFAGNGMDQQAMNILLTGNPASPEYALAYAHVGRARMSIDDQGRPVTMQPMDLSAVRKPAGMQANPAPVPEGTQTQQVPGGGTVTVSPSIAPKGPAPAEMAKLRAARSEVQKITEAAERFRSEWKKATPMEKSRAMLGGTTPLNSAYNNFALLLKGESGYNLGVLNGPDLEVIRRAIPDPSTLRGNVATMDSDMDSAVDQVKTMLRGGIETQEKQLGVPGDAAAPAPAGDLKKKYRLE